MLVTDVGAVTSMLETKCVDVGDGFGHFGYEHQLSFYITVGH